MQCDATCAPDPPTSTLPDLFSPQQMAISVANGAQELNIFNHTTGSLESRTIVPSLRMEKQLGKCTTFLQCLARASASLLGGEGVSHRNWGKAVLLWQPVLWQVYLCKGRHGVVSKGLSHSCYCHNLGSVGKDKVSQVVVAAELELPWTNTHKNLAPTLPLFPAEEHLSINSWWQSFLLEILKSGPMPCTIMVHVISITALRCSLLKPTRILWVASHVPHYWQYPTLYHQLMSLSPFVFWCHSWEWNIK